VAEESLQSRQRDPGLRAMDGERVAQIVDRRSRDFSFAKAPLESVHRPPVLAACRRDREVIYGPLEVGGPRGPNRSVLSGLATPGCCMPVHAVRCEGLITQVFDSSAYV
jgi:hypothetical protein